MRPLLVSLLILALMVLVPTVVLGQIPDPSADPGGFLNVLLTSFQGRQWVLVAGAGCVGIVWLLRRFGAKWVPWFATDRGGAVLVVVIGILTAVGSAASTGKLSLAALLDGLVLAFTASGMFGVSKKVAAPSDLKPAPAP